jgi:hypothetical protein
MNFYWESTVENAWIMLSSFLYPVLFAAFLALLLANLKGLRKRFSGIKKVTWAILFLIFFAALLLRLFFTTSGVDFRCATWESVNAGRYIAETGVVKICNGGVLHDCMYEKPLAHPAGYAYSLAAVFLLSGYSLWAATIVQCIVSSLTVLTVFLLAYVMTRDEGASLLSSTFLAVLPIHLMQSMRIEIGIATFSVFFEALALMFFFHALDGRHGRSIYLAVLGLAMALSFNMQNVMLYPIALLFYAARRGIPGPTKLLKKIRKNMKFLLVGLASAIVPFFVFIFYWLLERTRVVMLFSVQNFIKDAPKLLSLFEHYYMPYLLLFVISIPVLLWRADTRRLSLALLFWFSSFTVMYMFFENMPNQRYMMSTVIPFVLISGFGVSGIVGLLVKKRVRYLVCLAASLVLIASSPMFMEPDWWGVAYPMQDLVEVIGGLEEDAIVILPSINTIWGVQFYFPDRTFYGFYGIKDVRPGELAYLIFTKRCDYPPLDELCDYVFRGRHPVLEKSYVKVYELGVMTTEQLEELQRVLGEYDRKNA